MTIAFLNIGSVEVIIISLFLVITITAFVKYITNKNLKPIAKGVWILVICMLPFLGAIAYLGSYGWGKKN